MFHFWIQRKNPPQNAKGFCLRKNEKKLLFEEYFLTFYCTGNHSLDDLLAECKVEHNDR